METGVVRPGIVSDPFISGVDMGRFGVLWLIGEMTFGWRRTTALHTALGSASFLRPPLSSALLFRTACGRRIAAETRRPPSGRRAGAVTALRRATLLLLSSPLLSDADSYSQEKHRPQKTTQRPHH